ncbi:MAG: GNAT family N-acetyltransferase [Pseudomonadota bacterium]
MSEGRDYLGSEAQRAVLRRGRAVYELVKDDRRCTYYGRGVGVCTFADADDALMSSLLTLQGTTTIAKVTADEHATVTAQMNAQGVSVTRYDRWIGSDDALAKANEIIAETKLSKGLILHEISPDTPPETLDAFQRLAESCGVMIPNLALLRNDLRPGTCFVAMTETGEAVSCGAGAAFAHRGHPTMGREAWWGMLATAEAWRGHRLALLLGAHAIVSLRARLPGCTIMTGVQPGNAPSEAVCSKLGLAPDGAQVATIVDPAALPGGKLTS